MNQKAASGQPLLAGNSESTSLQDNIEIHPIDSCVRVILDTQINVLIDAKTKVAILRKVLFLKLELLHLQATFQQFFSLLSSHSAVNSDLFISPDVEGTNCQTSWLWKKKMKRKLNQKIPLESTGVCPVNCSTTFAALVSLSPLSPTQILMMSFATLISRMGFWSFFSLFDALFSPSGMVSAALLDKMSALVLDIKAGS